jgi:hypothetical protein
MPTVRATLTIPDAKHPHQHAMLSMVRDDGQPLNLALSKGEEMRLTEPLADILKQRRPS